MKTGFGFAAALTLVGCSYGGTTQEVSSASAQSAEAAAPEAPAAQSTETNAVLRSATIYVKDWDASVRFYTEYLNYESMGERPIDAPKSLATIGAAEGDSARIMFMRPRNSRYKSNPEGSFIALIEIARPSGDMPDYDRPDPSSGDAVLGEIVLAHQVFEIERIHAAMEADPRVTVVAPLGLSGSGRSRSFAALDPNGIRVEMYEFIEEPEDYR